MLFGIIARVCWVVFRFSMRWSQPFQGVVQDGCCGSATMQMVASTVRFSVWSMGHRFWMSMVSSSGGVVFLMVEWRGRCGGRQQQWGNSDSGAVHTIRLSANISAAVVRAFHHCPCMIWYGQFDLGEGHLWRRSE